MKRTKYIVIHFLALFLFPIVIHAQEVAVNEDGSNPAQSAMLDISSTDKGFLMPRMTTDEIASIDSPANGLIVYSTTDEKFYAYVLSEDIWKEIAYGAPPAWACGDALVDSRDSQSYTTVQIGTQCWMAENLNVGTRIDGSGNQTDNSTIEKYCYDDNTSNCDTYGGLYQWDEMMQYVTTEGIQGICPSGWYLPTDVEWKTMEMALGMSQTEADATEWRGTDEGGKMKETGYTHWNSPNTGATNSSGFTALSGGYRDSNGSFYYFGTYGLWWSSTEDLGTHAWSRFMYYNYAQVYRGSRYKTYGFSVRCLRDSQTPEQASNPSPADASTDQPISSTLSWTCSDPQSDPLTYDVYFGETNPPTLVASGQSATTYDPSSLNHSTTYYWKIVAQDDQSNSTEGVVWSFTTVAPWACGDALVDSRNSQNYTTVQIGTQCWMAENLNVGTRIDGSGNQTDNSTIEKYCYDDNTSNCNTYGGLYQWDEMMQYVTTESTQGICPTGWYLPSDTEWKTMEMFLGMSQAQADQGGYRGTDEGGKLKEAGTSHWISPNTGATNSSGFTVLPAGNSAPGGTFANLATFAWLWVSNEAGTSAYTRALRNDETRIYRAWGSIKSAGYSVRCIRDSQTPEQASNPSPADASTDQAVNSTLSWTCSDPQSDPLTYDVYFGETNPPTLVASGQSATTYDPGTLSNSTIYYWKIIAIDNHTNSTEGSVWSFSTQALAGEAFNPITGEIWMDRNLGASQVATSSTDAASYGDLYQWGRLTDGHQIRTSATTNTLSSTDDPGHGNFILAPSSPYDWRSPQNTNLWQGESGTNNPCPTGYRIPTETEFDAERASWSTNNAAGAFASPLKIPLPGYRLYWDGSLSNVGSSGLYWSSTIDGTYSRYLNFYSGDANMTSNNHAYGFSVRCIKN